MIILMAPAAFITVMTTMIIPIGITIAITMTGTITLLPGDE
jgi:hypothetical protein